MPVGGAYIRVYYSVLDDPKFETIYEDDHHLATWLRLLMTADQVWPADAPLPASARPASVKALVSAGLVDALPRAYYRIHGLNAERIRRSDAARKAAEARWHNAGNADASAAQSGNDASHTPAESEVRDPSPRSEGGSADASRPPTRRQLVMAWLTEHGYGEPSGWAHKPFGEMVRVIEPDELIALFDRARLDGVKLSNQLIRFVEQATSNGARPAQPKAKGLGPTHEEARNAFARE
jgi:hypothetical protein